MAAGYAYVGVSAQASGVEGGTPILGSSSSARTPGTASSSRTRPATAASTTPATSTPSTCSPRSVRPSPRPKRRPRRVAHAKHIVAVGESQSAFYLTTFADAFQPVDPHVRRHLHPQSGWQRRPAERGLHHERHLSGQRMRIRTDLNVPVFMFETQTDLIELGFAPAQQPDTAASAHGRWPGHPMPTPMRSVAVRASLAARRRSMRSPAHGGPGGLYRLHNWVDDGTPPPSPAPFKLTRGSTRPGPGQPRQRHRRGTDTGRRCARLNSDGVRTQGNQHYLLPFRADLAIHRNQAGPPVRHQASLLLSAVHGRPQQGHR